VTLRDRYRIVSNRESGRGRYDIAMYPLEKNQDAFLMEFKVWDKKKEKNLEETVESAFRQIEEKKYVTDLVTAGINEERIYKLGFAFAGKEVLVKEKI
ncbi:MAG: PD-(D/E)XK nuclease domain-containing protein, partial [Roseburia inulinivorans]